MCQLDMGRSLFADDGALLKRGRNVRHVVNKIQDGIRRVEEWGMNWRFKFSVGKTSLCPLQKRGSEKTVR